MREGRTKATAALANAARSLRIDAVTAEVTNALRGEGVRSVLLKGPSTARWLYGDAEGRGYVDSDLLVSPSGHRVARPVLERLGFVEHPEAAVVPQHGAPYAVPWERPADGAQLDLHRSLTGAGVEPALVWEVVLRHTEPMEIGGTLVEVLDEPGRAFMLAQHAMQHPEAPKPRNDLARALARLPESTWREAIALADEIDATGALAIGLRVLPQGDALADRLGVPSTQLVERVGVPGSRDRLAFGMARLAGTPSATARMRMLVREVAPPPEFMRWWSPLARRGSLGLALSYAHRLGWLLRRLVPSLRLWWTSR